MAKYHINPKTGNPGVCRAQEGKCPFGAADEHYSSPQEARLAYEKLMGQTVLDPEVYNRNLDYALELARLARRDGFTFPNHGASGEAGGLRLSLDQMREPLLAEGNCWTVANELIETYDGQLEQYDILAKDSRGLWSEAHSALCDPQDNVIIDFTFRQFDPTSSWPLITTPEDWRKRVSQAAGKSYVWDDFSEEDD